MACRICGNSASNTEYKAKEMMFGLRDEFKYFQCGECECLQVVSIPEDMSRFYPEEYYSFGSYSGKKFQGLKGVIRRWKYASIINKDSFFHIAILTFKYLFLLPNTKFSQPFFNLQTNV